MENKMIEILTEVLPEADVTECDDFFDEGQCEVSNWADVVAISAGRNHLFVVAGQFGIHFIGWQQVQITGSRKVKAVTFFAAVTALILL